MARDSATATAPSWLASLPLHPIFTLPSLPSSSNNTYIPSPSASELARPASPSLSTILPSSSRSNPYMEGAVGGGGGRKSKMVLVRGTEVVLAVGRELRILGLSELKSRSERSESPGSEREVDYKVLGVPAVGFEIQQLVVNPTSKLLAVVGVHSVVVVVLPRKGWSNSLGRLIPCRTIVVGKYYHSLPGSPAVAQVLWHPYGAQSSSLLILTSDALLREYTLSEDVEEPSQTVSFLPSGGGERRGGFSSDDAGEETAVGFCVGEGIGWGRLTVWGLMKNGDVRAVSPFLPRKATMPTSYVHSLATFVSSQSSLPSNTPSDPFLPNSSVCSTTSTTSHRPSSAPIRSSLQQQYVNALLKQLSSSLPSPDDDLDPSHSVDITLPSIILRHTPAPQGPFLLQPAPAELSNDAESFACDICFVNYSSTSLGASASESEDGLGVILVAFSDGKVDLCLVVEKVEGRWDAQDESEDSPSLAVYETIDLGLSSVLEKAGRDVGEELEENYPTFGKDSLYGDTVYVYHSLGAHCLLLSTSLDGLSDLTHDEASDDEGLQREVEKTLAGQDSTSVLWILSTLSSRSEFPLPPIVGMSIVNDIYLGYSLLLITSSLQLVPIELSLRVDPSLLPSDAADNSIFVPTTTTSNDAPAYVSLLSSPFVIPPFLLPRYSRPPVLHPPPSSSATLSINPETLRYMGSTVERFRTDIRHLVSAGDDVQCRLELQGKEVGRQLGKLRGLEGVSREGGCEDVKERLERVSSAQSDLLSRTDKLLQKLMDAHDPLLSNFERKWFDELGRIEREVVGGDRSLERRARRLEGQLEEIREGLEGMKRKGEEGGTLGGSQMKALESKLAEESKLIAEARSKVERLTSALSNSHLS